jgi:adenylate cyclase class 2
MPLVSYEIEVKFKVDDFAPVRRALRRAGAKYIATVIQTDSYYDTADRMLLGRDCGLRIRLFRPVRSAAGGIDTRPLLTAKGPRSGRAAKFRREVQTRLEDPQAVVSILEAMGLKLTLSIQKRRATYTWNGCLVELDELPVIGKFIEVEAGSEKALDRICRRLGLQAERITEHYVNLLQAAGGVPRPGRSFRLARGAGNPG